VAERCINHRLQGVMAIYNRTEYEPERIEATEAWSAELQRILGIAAPDNVVRMEVKR
jgi:hypothetical protein